MKLAIIALSVATLVACSSNPVTNSNEPIRNQKLSTSFTADGIKIESDCSWYSFNKNECNIVSIESTAVAATNGNSESNRRTALIRAGDRARAQVRHFINEEVSSSRVTGTIAKNVEKASDRLKSKTVDGETVAMSDTDAEKDSSHNVRENSNNTAYQLTETIRVNATGILRGFKTIKQEVVGPQEVSVTIRWDSGSDRQANELNKRFGK